MGSWWLDARPMGSSTACSISAATRFQKQLTMIGNGDVIDLSAIGNLAPVILPTISGHGNGYPF